MREDLEFSVPEVQLVGRFTCLAVPVQAEGTVASRAFYFRARDESWSFAVALSPAVDPVDIAYPSQGFLRSASYGSQRCAAGYMPLDDARAIITRCAREFLSGPPT